jgi:hypothetical protein
MSDRLHLHLELSRYDTSVLLDALRAHAPAAALARKVARAAHLFDLFEGDSVAPTPDPALPTSGETLPQVACGGSYL